MDNDTPRSAALTIPIPATDPEHVRTTPVPFDTDAGSAPYEETRVSDRALFDSFPDRVRPLTGGWGYEPILNQIWPCVVGAVSAGATVGEAFVRTRRCVERSWGVSNLELPVSRLADTKAFAGFAAHVLLDLPRFIDFYNGAIREYRRANHLHSKNHPAPELAHDGDWMEAPFWAWMTGAGRRERLFVRRVGSELEARAGARIIRRLPTDPAGLIAEWATLQRAGWKVRPRALSLTVFVRLCLADGFLHGIGGGKYDEVTDTIIERFFGITPPGFAVVTATLRLPIPSYPTTPDDVRRAERRVRDLDWKPETTAALRELSPDAVAKKAALIATEPTAKAARRPWFRELQAVTRSMRPAVAIEHDATEARLARMRRELVANDLLRSREYSWVLFPEARLREHLLPIG